MGFLIGTAATAWSGNPGTADLVLPQVGQRGTTVTVRVEGHHLETAEEVLFYRSGITCTGIRQLDAVPHNYLGYERMEKRDPGRVIELDFEIAPDAPLGEYFLRVRTRKKISEMLSFWVTPFPVVPEENAYADTDKRRNDRPEDAQEVPLNSTVVGLGSTNHTANDRDVYKVTLNKGQRCSCQILNARLGTFHQGNLTDMSIEVHDEEGQRIARASRSFLFAHDPVVSFKAPKAGSFYVTVKQQKDTEGAKLHYALHIGDFPRPALTFPLGGQAGKPLDLEVIHLDGTRSNLTAKLPGKVGLFEESMVDLNSVSSFPEIPSPNKVQAAPFPNVMETSGDGDQRVEQALPFALNGVIKTEGEKDWYRFTAKKGEKYRVRTYAMTLGSKLDPIIWIKPAEGTESRINLEQDDSSWEGHDWEGHSYRHQVKDRLDPIVIFEPDVDGDYLLGIADTRRESGADYVYRVEFQPHRDSAFTYFQPYPYAPFDFLRDVIGFHRGSSFDRPMMILNGFGSTYDGPMKLEAVGLPEGVRFESPVFTRKDRVIQTVWSVDASAELGSGLFELVPRALDDDGDIIGSLAQTNSVNDQRGGFAPHFNRTRIAAYGILEEAPFDIRIKQPRIGLARNAELDLEVHVTRKGDFKGALYLEATWLPTGVSKQPPIIIQAGEDVGYYKLSATNQAQVGSYQVTITARENEGGDRLSGIGFHYVCAPLVDIEVQEPYLEIALERTSFEQGKTGEIMGRVKYLREFSGTATASLLRLPHGVSLAEEPKISYGQEEVLFPLKVEPDALTGQYKEISCDVKISDDGQVIHQQSGSGVIRIDEGKGI
ncbi:MAG: PPC domain-containing protein [Verrucomicrobiota bacterium]